MGLQNEEDRVRFWRAYDTSWESLRPFREDRIESIKRYVGSEYGGSTRESRRRKTLVNSLLTMISTYSLRLAANRPQVMVSTPFPELKAFSKKYQTAINNHMREIQIESTLQDIVMDALFGIGIAKVYFAPGNPVQVPNPAMPPEPSQFDGPQAWASYRAAQQAMPSDIYIDAGMPYVERVSLDDFCFDMCAKEWRKVRWMAHTYRVPHRELMEDERIPEDIRTFIRPDSKWGGNPITGEETAQSALQDGDPDDLEDMVSLMDVYFPTEKKWSVVLAKSPSTAPLFTENWRGPEDGPFIPLMFHRVPDSVMPISMASTIGPLHDASNQLMRKATKQAVEQKTVLAYSGSPSDVKNIRDSSDMQAIRVTNPNNIREMRFNGADSPTVAFQQIIDQLLDRQAGNLHALAGLGPMSTTAKQDELIHNAVGGITELMSHRVLGFVGKIASNLGWMLWVDQTKRYTGQMRVPGLDFSVDASWTPEDREGNFWQYNFAVDPYSMPYRSPTEKIQNVSGFLNQVAPFLPMIAQQEGGMLRFQEITAYYAEMLNQPEIMDFWTWGAPIPPDSMPTGNMPQPNQQTTRREYVKQTAQNPQQQRMDMAMNMMQQRPSQGNFQQ